jgi:hypothetical protein
MSNKKNLLLATSFVLVTVVVFWVVKINTLPAPTDHLDAEKEIYSLLLVDLLSDKGIPLLEYTTLGLIGEHYIFQDSFVKLHEESAYLRQDTFVDFWEINKQSYSIREYLPSRIAAQMIEPHEWWVTLSRIGFNSRLTQALVIKERHMGCDNNGVCCYGEGSILFLRKVSGNWIVVDEFIDWMGECDI